MAFVLTRNQMEVLFYVERQGWSRARLLFDQASMVSLVGQGLLCAQGRLTHLTPLGAEALHAVRNGL